MFGDMPQYNAAKYSPSVVTPVKLTDNNREKINLNDRTISLDLHQYDLTRNMPMMMYNMLKKNYRVDGGSLKKV